MADDSEDDDVTSEIIKEAHLRLDDVPPELLPIHQKKIRERVRINDNNYGDYVMWNFMLS